MSLESLPGDPGYPPGVRESDIDRAAGAGPRRRYQDDGEGSDGGINEPEPPVYWVRNSYGEDISEHETLRQAVAACEGKACVYIEAELCGCVVAEYEADGSRSRFI